MANKQSPAHVLPTPDSMAIDAAIMWCKQMADAAQREAEVHDMQLSACRTYDEASAKRERRERCEGQAVAFRATAEKLAGDANTKSEEPTR